MNETGLQKERLYFIDWLRVLAMLAIFLYHNAKVFDFDEWHIKNPQENLGAAVFVEVTDIWVMPLFFVLSGAAVYYSLKSRAVQGFIKERSLRIALPWILLGIFIMGPVQVYLERVSAGEFSGSFLQFVPHYFDGFYGSGGNFAWMGLHLWYLMFLFFFSIIALPILLPRAKTKVSLLSKLSSRFGSIWMLLLLALPLFIASPLANVIGLSATREMGTWDILSYFLFFIYGYLLFSNSIIQEKIRKHYLITLIGAIISTCIILALEQSGALYFTTLRALCSWLWILSLLGLGSNYLNFNNKFLGKANEAVLPFYILHQTIIVILAYFIVDWTIGVVPKYLIISTISFVTIITIYEILIRRINILRFLFGMRLK